MDTLILAFFVQDSLIGIYELSWNLASMLALLSISIQSVLFPKLSELNEEDKNEQIIQLIDDSIVYTTLIMVPGLVGAAVIGSRILRIYAPEFTMGQYILIILVFSRLLASVGDQFLNTLNGIDRPDTVFRINALLVSSNLSLNVILIWQFGWYGAAVASLVSAMVPFGLGYRELRQSFSTMEFPKREIGYQTVAAVMMGIIVILFDNAMPIGNYVTLLITVSGAIVYAVVLLALSSRIRKKAFSVVPKSLVPQ
jgi:O-antigen/teichoic acid export membrane protein